MVDFIVNPEKYVFQSLIGRLQTVAEKDGKGAMPQFQSLIGRLQTKILGLASALVSEFQSLIGRLQTG